MNKAELIDAIAAESKLTKADSKEHFDAFLNAASKTLKKEIKLSSLDLVLSL